jgi:hypothetical protein
MTIYQKSALVALSVISGIFYVLPMVIVSLVTDTDLAKFTVIVISFVVPLLACGFILSNWAGRAIPVSKVPSFVMPFVSMLCAVLSSTFLMWIFFPSYEVGRININDLEVLAIPAVVMAAFGTPAAFFAALLFIGGCKNNMRSH